MQSKYLFVELIMYFFQDSCLFYNKFLTLLDNVNVRMGMPRYPNPQPRMIRPVVNFNYIPSNNNNNFHDQGSMQRYPAPGITFRYE
jgi:hypothetical protein